MNRGVRLQQPVWSLVLGLVLLSLAGPALAQFTVDGPNRDPWFTTADEGTNHRFGESRVYLDLNQDIHLVTRHRDDAMRLLDSRAFVPIGPVEAASYTERDIVEIQGSYYYLVRGLSLDPPPPRHFSGTMADGDLLIVSRTMSGGFRVTHRAALVVITNAPIRRLFVVTSSVE